MEDDLQPLLNQALALVVDATEAERGYLEIEHADESGRRWSIAHGFTQQEVATVQTVISRGIIAAALAANETIMTESAMLDPRFSNRTSVRAGRIDGVLCVPIRRLPAVGVVYLEGRAGARRFSPDDRDKAELFSRLLAPLADRLLIRDRRASDWTLPFRAKLRLGSLIGHSEALAALFAQIELVAPLNVHVLITGDSGTGKSHVARAIHDNGPRSTRPFVELNCAALPETLLESELFGALPGAHSTAVQKLPGKIAAAEQGTLFLDEVGELSLASQAKLLHLVQAGQYYPLGSPKPVQANVRVIAATNIDLQAGVAERRFREDLFYRLQVLPIRVPTLAERPGDIALLAASFCMDACDRHGFPRITLASGAVNAAESAEWPGHVRQLAHAVEAAVIRASADRAERVKTHHLFPEVPEPRPDDGIRSFQDATRDFQAGLLRGALESSGWNVADVARRLDIARSHAYNLIRAFGLRRDLRH